MQAASRESYAAAAQSLEAYVAGAEPDDIARVADEVLAAAALLRREPRLRRALADPARSGDERVELFRGLFDGKVSDDTADVLTELVRGRWSTGGDLLDAAELVGVDALLGSAERAGQLADVEDELFRFGQIAGGDPRLAVALGDSTATPERRAELVRGLLEGKAAPATIRLAELALAGLGGRGFSASLTRLVELAALRRGRSVAYVTVAAPLTDAEEERLGTLLTGLYGREVSVQVIVDPDALGGMSVQVGDSRYDGTIRRRLHDTRIALTGR
jgi:F-type H+-transporting ATPase subunit delta